MAVGMKRGEGEVGDVLLSSVSISFYFSITC